MNILKNIFHTYLCPYGTKHSHNFEFRRFLKLISTDLKNVFLNKGYVKLSIYFKSSEKGLATYYVQFSIYLCVLVRNIFWNDLQTTWLGYVMTACIAWCTQTFWNLMIHLSIWTSDLHKLLSQTCPSSFLEPLKSIFSSKVPRSLGWFQFLVGFCTLGLFVGINFIVASICLCIEIFHFYDFTAL